MASKPSRGIIERMFARKSIAQVQRETQTSELKRSLGKWNLLLLGVGVDYGIFLLEHRDDPASWLAVSLGAASTLLAFGLLALSATPALHSFGLSLLLGIGLVWLLSPCFRKRRDNGALAH